MPNESQTPLAEGEWWKKYAEGNWIGLSFIPALLAEHKKRIRSEIEKLKNGDNKDSCFYSCQECGGHDAALDAVLNLESLK